MHSFPSIFWIARICCANKKKRCSRALPGDKTGRGLRQFSMRVCEKVESKARITYNE
ncbi:hypothetical protein GIB67_017523, partial [Kingdonia uniflora]